MLLSQGLRASGQSTRTSSNESVWPFLFGGGCLEPSLHDTAGDECFKRKDRRQNEMGTSYFSQRAHAAVLLLYIQDVGRSLPSVGHVAMNLVVDPALEMQSEFGRVRERRNP